MISSRLCVSCCIEFRAKKNGVLVVVMGEYGPLECYAGDLYECPQCKNQIVSGVSHNPIGVGTQRVEDLVDEWMCDGNPVLRFFLNQKEKDVFTRRVPEWRKLYKADN